MMEAILKRKTHMAAKDMTGEYMKIRPLCNQSEETIIRGYGDLKLTGSKNATTCKKCIRSLTGRYTR